MKRQKKTKIVCTIGPASWDVKVLKKMINAGMNVARVNAAFTDIPQLQMIAKNVREISNNVALMLDIKGNDVRLNNFAKAIKIKPGDIITIGNTTEDLIYPTNYLELHKDLQKGNIIYFDDGNVKTQIDSIRDGKINCKVITGKILEPGKSLNTPGIFLSLPPVTKVDKVQMEFAIKDNWDFVAASYIRNANDVKYVRRYLKNTNIKLIAKIEEGMGVDNIEEILEEVDGIMVARGDMGVELPYEQIPAIQKSLISRCNTLGKQVITATQVMESMKHSPIPTRAEISDVANAVLDGTDAIMTSGETTVGEFPVETVEAITRIALENEKYLSPTLFSEPPHKEDLVVSSICNAALEVVTTGQVDKVIMLTESGRTARFMARHNLNVQLITYTSNPTTARQLAMSKGVNALPYDTKETTRDKIVEELLLNTLEKKLISKTDNILVIGRSKRDKALFPHLFEYINIKDWLKRRTQ